MNGCRIWPAVLLVLALVWLPLPGSNLQAAPQEPGAFIETLGQRAIKLLQNKSATVDEQRAKFRALLREGFATRRIGYFVIGKYRRSADRAKVDEFVKTFENYIVELYSSQFRNYSGETFKVVRVQKTTRPTDFIVTTHILRPNGERIFKIAFQVHRRAGKPNKILDVKIEGVSMILTQRDEFIAYISQQDGRVQALIDVLNKRIAKLKSKGLEPTNDTAGEPATSPSAEKPAEVPEPKKEPSSDEKEDEEEQDQG